MPTADPPAERPHSLTDHVVFVSIDTLRPQIYRDDSWPAPTLHELAQHGAFALAVRSVFPALTYPAHATHGHRRAPGAPRHRRQRTVAVVPLLPIEHVAPFVAALLHLDLPDVDGTLLPGLLSTVEEVSPSRRP